MNAFAELLDRLAYEPRRNAKLRLLQDYFARTPDPERGYALGAMTDTLSFREAKPALIRALVEERVDPVLFRLSHNYVGDLAETTALIWPGPDAGPVADERAASESGAGPLSRAGEGQGEGPGAYRERRAGSARQPSDPFVEFSSLTPTLSRTGEGARRGSAAHSVGPDAASAAPRAAGLGHNNPPPPTLAEVVETLATTAKKDLPAHLAHWLDALDETGRWALLKLVTGNLRVGVSARLAKTAVGALGGHEADAVEEVWHGLTPPFAGLFAWVEGKGERPETLNPAPFRPPMLSHPIEEEADLDKLDAAEFAGEWKWDGIRVQLVGGRDREDGQVARVYSRTGEDITGAFPDLAEAITFTGSLDGELLILREGRVQSFNVLQQRLNRKAVTGKLLEEFPAHVRAYDILAADGADLRTETFETRRARLEAFVARLDHARIDLSPTVPFANWADLAAARADPASVGAGEDADAIEGVMLKRRSSPYLPGRPKGPWWKWKREPHIVDAVMMYAQRGHGKRSSFYSDYTFGVWREGPEGDELVPVGKCYHGFTDAELQKLDRYVRNHTTKRFGPVREVAYGRATLAWCWRSPSRACSARPGTNRAWRCAFPGSAASAGKAPGRGRPHRRAGAHPRPRRARDRPRAGAGGDAMRQGRIGGIENFSAGEVQRRASARLTIATQGQGFTDFTEAVAAFLRQSGIRDGLVHVFCRHTSASLTIQENADPDVQTDLMSALDNLAPRGAGYVHGAEGPDDMPAHIRTLLSDSGLTIPVADGRLALGTWQGIYLIEHRDRPHRREIMLGAVGA